MKVGDYIECKDADDMVETMQNLEFSGVTTDFVYERNGVKGFWLIVEKINDG